MAGVRGFGPGVLDLYASGCKDQESVLKFQIKSLPSLLVYISIAMQKHRFTYQKSIRGIAIALVLLLATHVLSIHGFAEALVYCFEEDGQVNLESEIGSLFSIPDEDHLHAETFHQHDVPTFDAADTNHNDVALSLICSKEQQITRFDQERTLKFLDAILNTHIEKLPRSRVFQLVSFIPPLIEDLITTSLRTIVLLN